MSANSRLAEQRAEQERREQEAAQAEHDAEAKRNAEVKVGEDPPTPPDDKHAATHPLTDPEAAAPLLAEQLPNPEDAYAQNPPPAREPGPSEATEPPLVREATGQQPADHDARGYPVNPPEAPQEDEENGSKTSG